MSSNPYKDYYNADKYDDGYSGVRKAEARKRIKDLEYAASWTGEPVKVDEEYKFSGGS